MTKELICILCPLGCRVKVELDGTKVGKVLGIKCKKGIEYTKKEIVSPVRVLTTTMKTARPDAPLLPVRSDKPIPKEKFLPCMEEITQHLVEGPVELGQIVIKGILGLEANIVACRSLRQDDR
jgi:CxxC motif-containing protein